MPSPWLSPLRQPPRFASCSPQTLFCVCRCRSCSRSARSHSYSKDSRVKEMSVIEMSRAIVRKNVVIEGESAAHERYVRARVVRKQKRPSTLIATITIRGVRVQTLIARFFSTTAKTLTTKGEEVIQSRERERKNSINNNKRERERERRRQNALERLSLFFLRTDTTALTDFFGAVVLETTRTPVNWVVVSANIFYSRRRVMMMMIMRR